MNHTLNPNDINNKFECVSKLVGYAKILLSKKDFIQASLLSCKAFEILSLSEFEECWLIENDPFYKIEIEKTKDKKLTANEKMSFMLKHYYLRGVEELSKFEIINKTTNGVKTIAKLRNNLIHNYADFSSPIFIQEASLLIDKLMLFPFIKDRIETRYGSIRNITCNYEAERDFKVDLGISSKSEVSMTPPTDLITFESFENLIDAKENIFLTLRDILHEYCDHSMLDIDNLQISTVDSTSAYVWLTIPIKTRGNILPDNYRTRAKLYVPTISILMTPKEFWIYLEFAGFTHRYKLAYYEYLLEGNHLKHLITRMQQTDFNDELACYPCLRNVHWYVFENSVLNLSKISDAELDSEVNYYKKQLKEWLREKQASFFKKSREGYLKPLSWNVALLGWVYPYESFSKAGISISDFHVRIQDHIEKLLPIIRYMRNIPEPFKNDTDDLLINYKNLCSAE